MSLFEQQIVSQPQVLEHLLVDPTTKAQVHAAAEGLHRVKRIWVVGTGSSQHVAALGAAMLQDAGRSAHAVSSMQFVRNAPIVGPHDGVVIVSHSGDSAYSLAARALAFSAGLQTFTITRRGIGMNDVIETVDREPIETASVGVTSALTAFAMIAAQMGAESVTDGVVGQVPGAVAAAIGDPGLGAVPPSARSYLVAGVGPAAIAAAEGALKLREAARALAIGGDAEYLLHGGVAALDPSDHLIAVAVPDDDGFLAAFANAASSHGIGVTRVYETTPLPPVLAQIPIMVRLQLVALRVALARGADPDAGLTGGWGDPGLWSIGRP
jgi:glucosamine 6-phosphate synthetase-like amidotransferase/phosphosugar isomerase protein